jgi:hypothetical protein
MNKGFGSAADARRGFGRWAAAQLWRWAHMNLSACFFIALPLAASAAPLNCDVGPATKTFGGAPWLVYSCNDPSTVIVVSAPGSPAAPFYFALSFENGSYRIRGEGTGAKSVTDAALHQLQSLSTTDIQALRRETIAHGK